MSFMVPVFTMAAGVTTATAQIQEGQTQQAVEEYNANVALAEANVTEQTAEFESEIIKEGSKLDRLKISQEKQSTLSAQKAAYAKSGVRVDVGSPLEVAANTAAQYELDLSTNEYNTQADLEKIRFESEVGAARLRTEAEHRKVIGKEYRKAGYLKAGATLLTTGAKVSSQISQIITTGAAIA